MTDTDVEDVPEWLSQLAAKAWVEGPPLGTVEHIDRAARARAVGAVSEFEAVTVGRPLRHDSTALGGTWTLERSTHQVGPITSAYDHFEIECHGLDITHLDALNHLGRDGRWYRGVTAEPDEGVSLGDLAARGIVTRGVFLDIPAVRGTPWVEIGTPVDEHDLDSALALAGTTIEPGDAILLYMGRDEMEATGRAVKPIADSPEGRPGVGEAGSRWIASTSAAVLAWDLNDAHGPGLFPLSVHMLIWGMGLLLVDNCDFHSLREVMRRKEERTGMFTVCPLKLDGSTGCAVNPVVMV
jgi:kynurenine formamidase